MKRFLSVLTGAVVGIGGMLLLFPYLASWIVGPIHGDDQMNANLVVLIVGLLAFALIGAFLGNKLYSKLRK
ncbi:hypothetical protein LQ759_06285 [Serratia marcescens]|uniref:hypothetical protein n=1 Tax=Serratia TaxID=613 RepID=UPI001F2B8272|nr:hypothetical protein [Serratia ficaria]MCF1609489.1 hypothetical protein [Serratia marcescens]CAI1062349.1 Uncharacterised protein [Serratia ficaria]CAI1783964.1 Uncharacterised protein [Serratia ficaria]CAI2408270.1 Uncharacterised protein [Serratia ficaria]CAI2514961.1 Uncharacterised protein [Serratia ficaria]